MLSEIDVCIPSTWLGEIEKLNRATNSDFVLAGGAPSDLVHGKPVKDLDLFEGYTEERFQAVQSYLEDARWERFSVISPEYEHNMTDVKAVLGYHPPLLFDPSLPIDALKAELPALNVILLKDPTDEMEETLQRMDFGMRQYGCRADGVVFATEAAAHDTSNKTFTLLRTEQKERSLKRYQRLRDEKYSTWRLVDPETEAKEYPQYVTLNHWGRPVIRNKEPSMIEEERIAEALDKRNRKNEERLASGTRLGSDRQR